MAAENNVSAIGINQPAGISCVGSQYRCENVAAAKAAGVSIMAYRRNGVRKWHGCNGVALALLGINNEIMKMASMQWKIKLKIMAAWQYQQLVKAKMA